MSSGASGPLSCEQRTLVLGLGNSILGDDGVGPAVAREVGRLTGAEVAEAAASGLPLLGLLSGYDRVIIVDAIVTGRAGLGTLHKLPLEGLKTTASHASTHQIGLGDALEMGRALGMKLPEEVRVYAIEVADPYTFAEALSPALQAAVPQLARRIAQREFAPLLEGAAEA